MPLTTDYPPSLKIQSNKSYSEFPIQNCGPIGMLNAMDKVAEETPIALEYNRLSYAVMMASPEQLEDFAVGFSLSEGIVHRLSDIHEITVIVSNEGITLRLTINANSYKMLKNKRRNMISRTGCGLCGIENLQQLYLRPLTVVSTAYFSIESLQQGFDELKCKQPLRQQTGCTHAAAWMNKQGKISHIREDIGRHNALDKLLGAVQRESLDFSQGAVLITSRATYEIVLKSVVLGVGLLAILSAPTGMAIRLAETAQLTLVRLMRDKQLCIYTHPSRIMCTNKIQKVK